MRKFALIFCSLLLVSCADPSTDDSTATADQLPTGPPSTSPASSPLPASSPTRAALEVSDAATCQTLIGADGGLVSETGQFLIDVTELSDTTEAEAVALADALQGVGDTSSEKFGNLLTVMQEPFRDLAAAHETGEKFTLDPSRFKAAGNEVISLCEPILGDGATEGSTGETEVAVPAPRETKAVPEPTATPPTDGGSYPSIEELRRAYVKAGGECSTLDQANQITLAAESGHCSGTTVISTYLSKDDISTLIQQNKEITAEIDVDFNSVWLVGQNWVINSDDAEEVQKKMGGQLISF